MFCLFIRPCDIPPLLRNDMNFVAVSGVSMFGMMGIYKPVRILHYVDGSTGVNRVINGIFRLVNLSKLLSSLPCLHQKSDSKYETSRV